jgi:uncharacterized protein DUF6289
MTRRLVTTLALVLATAGVPVVAAGPAQAIPACRIGYQCTRTYYATAARDLEVGGSTTFCDGSGDSWGTMTRYIEVTQAKCGVL